MRQLLFEEWSPDPAIREQQIELAIGKRRPSSLKKPPKKRKATKAWDVPKAQRFWERAPWQDQHINRLPRWVRCAEDFKADKMSYRARREVAVDYKHVQQNCGYRIHFISADLDHRDGVSRCMNGHAPLPNFICENPVNGHVHASWILWKAVWEMNPKACSFACAIERAITRRLDGDIAFSMTGLVKNPLHDYWNTIRPREEPYTLGELNSFFNAKEMKPWAKRERQTGFGRNCTIFDRCGEYARRIVLDWKRQDRSCWEFKEHIQELADEINYGGEFAFPLGPSEVAEVVEQVAGWTWRYFSEEGKHRWHSMKGRAGMKSRWAGHVTAKVKADELGISPSTYCRRQSRSSGLIPLSPPDIVIVSQGGLIESHQPKIVKPWSSEGISRAQWYRRQAKATAA